MLHRFKFISLFVLCISLALTPAWAKKKKKKDEDKEHSIPITQVLKQGPWLTPLPAFHDAKVGGVEIASLTGFLKPIGPNDWPTESDDWSVQNLAKGKHTFEPPSADHPAALVLAFYVHSDGLRKRKLSVEGEHPIHVWLNDNKVESTEKPITFSNGKHLIRVESVFDPSKDEPWEIGIAWKGKSEDELTGVRASLDPSRGVTIEDIIDAPDIGTVAVSPDGKKVAWSVSRWIEGSSKRESWLEIRDLNGDLISTWRGGFGMNRVRWSPKGTQLSYVTKGIEGEKSTSTLWIADLETGATRPLLEKVKSLGSYRWAPSGEFIVFSTSVKAPEIKNGVKRLEGLRDRWSSFRTKSYLNQVWIKDGRQRRLTAGEASTSLYDLSIDSQSLLFGRAKDNYEVRPYTLTELYEMDLKTLEATKLDEIAWLGSALYVPGSKDILLGGPADIDSEGVNVGEGQVPNLYDSQIFLWEREKDSITPLSRDFDPSIRSRQWGHDGHLYLTVGEEDFVRLYRLNWDDKTYKRIDTGLPMFTTFSLADRADVGVGLGNGPWASERVVRINLKTDRATMIHVPAEDWYKHVENGKVESWSYQAQDGKTIESRIYFPPNFDPQQSWPVIVYYYGGTSPVTRDFGGRYPKEYWASNGYVVFVPQPSGATGFGQSFSAEHVNNWGKTTAQQIIDGTEAFLEAHPWADRSAVGCIGASYGGFMTMLLTTMSDLYAGAVAHAGISSLSSYWGEGYWGYLYSAAATADSFPWNRKDLYVDQSPLFRADQVKVPILLTHGAADTNVPVGESDQFYAALKLLGKEVEYLRIAGEDHWILSRDKRIQWSKSIVAWFDRTLKKDASSWDAMYPPLTDAADEDVDDESEEEDEEVLEEEAATASRY